MKQPSWRSVLPVHPAAELFPLMPPDDLKALGEDIKANGLREPVKVIQKREQRPDGKFYLSDPPIQRVLDGRSRLDAMELVDLPVLKSGRLDPKLCEVLDKDEIDLVAYVISANIHRRHLSADDKRDLIAKLLKVDPSKSDRQIAEMTKTDHKTVGSERTEMEGREEIPHVAERRDTRGRKQPSRKSRKLTEKPQGTTKPSAPTDDKPASQSKSRCSICHEKKPAVLQPVFICDSCVNIHEIREAVLAADDGLDIPESLRRSTGGCAW